MIKMGRYLEAPLLLKIRGKQSRVGGSGFAISVKRKDHSVNFKLLPGNNILHSHNSFKKIIFKKKIICILPFIVLLLPEYCFGTFVETYSERIIAKKSKFEGFNWLMSYKSAWRQKNGLADL